MLDIYTDVKDVRHSRSIFKSTCAYVRAFGWLNRYLNWLVHLYYVVLKLPVLQAVRTFSILV